MRLEGNLWLEVSLQEKPSSCLRAQWPDQELRHAPQLRPWREPRSKKVRIYGSDRLLLSNLLIHRHFLRVPAGTAEGNQRQQAYHNRHRRRRLFAVTWEKLRRTSGKFCFLSWVNDERWCLKCFNKKKIILHWIHSKKKLVLLSTMLQNAQKTNFPLDRGDFIEISPANFRFLEKYRKANNCGKTYEIWKCAEMLFTRIFQRILMPAFFLLILRTFPKDFAENINLMDFDEFWKLIFYDKNPLEAIFMELLAKLKIFQFSSMEFFVNFTSFQLQKLVVEKCLPIGYSGDA